METEDQIGSTLNDRSFYPWRIPASAKAEVIVEEAIGMLQNYEGYYKKRRRKRRPADQAIFEGAVAAVLCEVMHLHLVGFEGGIYVPRSNQVLGRKSRYRHPALGKTFPNILDIMTAPEMAFIEQDKGHEGLFSEAKRTTIRPGWRTLDRINSHGVTLDDLGISRQEEVIILRRKKKDIWDEGGNQDYTDSADTIRFRFELSNINDWLRSAEIEYVEYKPTADPKMVDTSDRQLRRIFTQERFDSGGRLFGGFWQRLSKNERRNGLLIDSEEAVELDYGQMNPRIIYGMAGVQPPKEDLYDIPSFDGFRRGIKKVMNAMMFTEKPLSRMPKGVRKSFSESHSIQQVTSAIENAHPGIASMFYTAVGHEAQYVESKILVDLLLRLKEQSIVALPIHDAVIVPRSVADQVKQLMLTTFHDHTGVQGKVSLEV